MISPPVCFWDGLSEIFILHNRALCSHKPALPEGCENSGTCAFSTREEQHPLAHDMSPVATGSGGRPALRTAPPSYAKTGDARRPGKDMDSVQRSYVLANFSDNA